jgi:hypothetical protein
MAVSDQSVLSCSKLLLNGSGTRGSISLIVSAYPELATLAVMVVRLVG